MFSSSFRLANRPFSTQISGGFMGLVHDYIGVGFGPSNLALAIATEEFAQRSGREPNVCFIERKPAFSWHEGMLIDGSSMQISFLKDLATLRNPASRFTFISYLKARGRLEDFINLKTFYPSREEFNDYLGWAADAAHLDYVGHDDAKAVRANDAGAAKVRKLDHLSDVAARTAFSPFLGASIARRLVMRLVTLPTRRFVTETTSVKRFVPPQPPMRCADSARRSAERISARRRRMPHHSWSLEVRRASLQLEHSRSPSLRH
jgi:hypothetical protein